MEARQIRWLWTQDFHNFVPHALLFDFGCKVNCLFVLFVYLILVVPFENKLSHCFSAKKF
jgi:hypothetical protein